VVRNVDLVIDTASGGLPQHSYGVLKEGGRLVASAMMLSQEVLQAQAESRGIHASDVMAMPNAERLLRLAEQIDERVLGVLQAALRCQTGLRRRGPGRV